MTHDQLASDAVELAFNAMRADNNTVLAIECAIEEAMSRWVDDVGDHRFETRVQAESAFRAMIERGYTRTPPPSTVHNDGWQLGKDGETDAT